MPNLVNGYSDLVSRVNLATNGNFRINQRGSFSSFSQVNLNDFVSDCWRVDSCSIDFCECENRPGVVDFRGRGKTGQEITLKNRDMDIFGYPGFSNEESSWRGELTAAVTLQNQSYSIPVQLTISPRYHTTTQQIIYQNFPIAKEYSGKKVVTAVQAMKTRVHEFNQEAYIRVYLKADGEFNFALYGFRELAGLYRNPPYFTPVSYADDLARCERYYQTGHLTNTYLPMKRTVSGNESLTYVNFRTTMGGSPSTSVPAFSSVYLYQDPQDGISDSGNVVGSSVASTHDSSDRGFRISITKSGAESGYSFMGINLDWVAEI